jgi:hypothetical protein
LGLLCTERFSHSGRLRSFDLGKAQFCSVAAATSG